MFQGQMLLTFKPPNAIKTIVKINEDAFGKKVVGQPKKCQSQFSSAHNAQIVLKVS